MKYLEIVALLRTDEDESSDSSLSEVVRSVSFWMSLKINTILLISSVEIFKNLIFPEIWHKNINQKNKLSERHICIEQKRIFSNSNLFIARLAEKEMVATNRVNRGQTGIAFVTIGRSWKNIIVLKNIKLLIN